jgi:RND family efflux transporter MFP subunit
MRHSSSFLAATHHLRRRSLIVFLPLAAAIALPAGAQEQKTRTGEFDCLIAPKMVLKLGTPVPGLLSEVLVDRGAVVRKGDVIAKLESGVEAAAAALAQARADNDSTIKSSRARRDFQLRKEERAKQLRRTDNIALSAADEAETAARVAESEYQEAEVNLQLARLDLARATEVLKQRTIRSPINGVVVERKLGPGEYAFDQAHLVTVSQIDPLNVEVYVPLSQFGRIHLGNSAQVYPEVGGEYTAIVTVVDQVFDAASGTIGIRLELPNPDYALPAGLKCQIRFAGMG